VITITLLIRYMRCYNVEMQGESHCLVTCLLNRKGYFNSVFSGNSCGRNEGDVVGFTHRYRRDIFLEIRRGDVRYFWLVLWRSSKKGEKFMWQVAGCYPH
jgi:hypothetical protein